MEKNTEPIGLSDIRSRNERKRERRVPFEDVSPNVRDAHSSRDSNEWLGELAQGRPRPEWDEGKRAQPGRHAAEAPAGRVHAPGKERALTVDWGIAESSGRPRADSSARGGREGKSRIEANGNSRAKSGRASAHRADTDAYGFNYKKRDAERRARIRRNRIFLAAVLLLLVAGLIGGRILLTVGSGMNSFYDGVTVDGLNLKGYDKAEAIGKLTDLNAKRLSGITVTLRFGDREWTISPEQLGASLDIQEQVDKAWEQGREGNIFARQARIGELKRNPYAAKTTLSYDTVMLREILAQIKEEVDMPAKDAAMDFDTSREEMFRVIPEEKGRTVHLDDLFALTKSHLDDGLNTVIEIRPLPVEPQIREVDLRDATQRIHRAKTSLGSSKAERVHNIKLALSKFDGMIVMPGQEVSFNQTTGPRGLAEGYQNAGVILDDEIVDGPGGGVCQASTTLYQALVRSGIEIVSRSKHSLPVSYVEKGTDAAVAYDYKDLVFRNNTDAPIYLECRIVSGTSVSVTVYGRALEEGVEIKILSELLETIPAPEPEIVADTAGTYVKYTDEQHVRKASREGYRVKSYAVTYKDGVEVSRKDLTSDYYKEVKGTTYVGVTPRPAQSVPVIAGADET